ncbi:nucleotide-binding alpha-beta plait domain-containing protein [Tanacetum coccineum]
MHGDETLDAYLNRAQEYADALAAIGKPVKEKDLVMLAVSGLREEYNGLKTTITARQSPTAFSELHALLSDHDYMLGKTRAPAPSITSSFAANHAVGSPSMPQARQTQLSEFGFLVSPIAPSGPQAFYGARPSNNNLSNNNNRGNRNNSRGNNNNRGRGNGRQFDWASTQNTVYVTFNTCSIGHIPSQCPNCDPSTSTRPSAAQLSELVAQLSALGFLVSPIAPSGPQAFYGARPSNWSNNNNHRGNRNNSRGNNNNRGRGNGRQFDWASTQNTVYGTFNRCGIGHIPSQCPNRDPSTIRTRPSANFANTGAQSSNASANWHSLNHWSE